MIFSTLLNCLLPLCFLVGLGYVAGKYCAVRLSSLSTLIIYFFTPAVYLTTIIQMDLKSSLFLLPVIMFILCSIMAVVGYRLASALAVVLSALFTVVYIPATFWVLGIM